jgi:hypothetical protein
MKRLGILLAFTVFGAALGTSGPASATEVSCWYNGGVHSCIWYPGYTYAWYPGYTNSYAYPFGSGLGAIATAPLAIATDATAPLVTGRSVAVENVPLTEGRSAAVATVAVTGVAGSGNYCATSVKTCLLREPGWLGTGCSCRIPGGHARGFVQ